MAEYIKKEALMFALCKEIIGDGDYYNGKDDMQDQIRDMVSQFPATDATPVKHGRWIAPFLSDGGNMCAECSNCHKIRIFDDYCSACGAIMDLNDLED